jgi:hypothetical protein
MRGILFILSVMLFAGGVQAQSGRVEDIATECLIITDRGAQTNRYEVLFENAVDEKKQLDLRGELIAKEGITNVTFDNAGLWFTTTLNIRSEEMLQILRELGIMVYEERITYKVAER